MASLYSNKLLITSNLCVYINPLKLFLGIKRIWVEKKEILASYKPFKSLF